MVLAFGCCVFDQIIIGQLLRAHEYGPATSIASSKANVRTSFGGALSHAGQTFRKLCTRLDFDIGGQTAQHIVEQRDLFVGIAARAGGKQIGNSIDDSETVFGGRGGDRADQLVEE